MQFIDLVYRNNTLYAVFVSTKTVRYAKVNTNHKPYFYTPEEPPKWMRYTLVEKYHPILGKHVKLYKVEAERPQQIPALRQKFKKTYESHVPYVLRLVIDAGLVPGSSYNGRRRKFFETIDEPVEFPLNEVVAFDIEVLAERIPTAIDDYERYKSDLHGNPSLENREVAKHPVVSVALTTKEGTVVHVLEEYEKREFTGRKEVTRCKTGKKKWYTVVTHRDEEELLRTVVTELKRRKVWVTFNGSVFDIPYLYYRSKRLGLDFPSLLPVAEGTTKTGERALLVYPDSGIHIDLFLWFSKNAIQNYAHKGSYKEYTLDAVARGVLGKGKVKLSLLETPSSLDCEKLVEYNATDARLTYELFLHDLTLLILLMRATYMPLSYLLTTNVMSWIENILYREAYDRNMVIPSKDEIPSRNVTRALSSDKKYRGAYVKEPPVGVFFDVWVYDIASLYPSVIERYNVSFETVDNPHIPCKRYKEVKYEGKVIHRICQDRPGFLAEVVKLYKQLRLKYKRLAKQQKNELYEMIQQSLKVLINAMYGVLGNEKFILYSGGAECVTLLGVETIRSIEQYANTLGIPVLYVDTDSLFLWSPGEEKAKQVQEFARKKGFELEFDGKYKLALFSGRKKNYILVSDKVTVKGLVAKKSNIPPAIRDFVSSVLSDLTKVDTPDKLLTWVNSLNEKLREFERKLKERRFKPEELAFSVTLNKDLDEYKSNAVHVRLAKLLQQKYGVEVKRGTKIRYLYDAGDRERLLDEYLIFKKDFGYSVKKYKQYLYSTIEQILDAVSTRNGKGLQRWFL